MIVLEKILSGGQTGADIGALRAARKLGLATGGHAPRGWRTQDGPAPQLADYGLVESPWGYAGRTKANVRDADATVRFARDFNSAGELCTMRAIDLFKKPWLDVEWRGGASVSALLALPGWSLYLAQPPNGQVAWGLSYFLEKHSVRVLNVAGNSERTAPGIGAGRGVPRRRARPNTFSLTGHLKTV